MKHAWSASYRRWEGESVGVWQRRLSIARYGLRLCLTGKVITIFLILSLSQALGMAGIFFVFGQLVAPESALLSFIANRGGEQAATLINALSSWALLYPEICVDGVYRLVFFAFEYSPPFFTLIVVSLFVHKLIANDLASNAIVIYNSKALTRWDYLIGKFLVVSTILSIIWIFPILIAWLIGNLLSPDWSFFYHSFPSLVRGLLLGFVAVVSLSLLAMLVSSLAKRSGAAVTFWILGWVSLNAIGGIGSLVHPSLRYVSPSDAIGGLTGGIYRIADFLAEAQSILPFFGGFLSQFDVEKTSEIPIGNGDVLVPILALTLYSVISVFVVSRRVRAQ